MSKLELQYCQDATVLQQLEQWDAPRCSLAWELDPCCVGLSEITSHDHLQYLTNMEADSCLHAMFNALVVGGHLSLSVPDLDALARQWLKADWNESTLRDATSDAQQAFQGIFGPQEGTNPMWPDYQARHRARHLSGYNSRRLKFLLERAGFIDVDVQARQGTLYADATKSMNQGERQIATNYTQIRVDHLSRYRFAVEQFSGEERLKLLDLACGIGYGSKLLAEQLKAHVNGVDIDRGAIDYAKHYYAHPQVHYICQDARELAIEHDSLDGIISFETIEHIDFAKTLLAHFYQWLRPGGRLIASTPNQAMLPYDEKRFPFHLRHYHVDQMQALLEDAGFEIEQIQFQSDQYSEQISKQPGEFTIMVAMKG
ncbi:MAG: Ubiquinone biosynthesis O-methyltransferase, mitochondrial [Candidatus Celerinatantimonas neptuna]|nr:MAG: Ubiquinone biosynthesis O-methyltransferase, mitochondrial [Candidatus Celerinatantimonas neptuna]